MRAAPDRTASALRLIARKSRRVGIASLVMAQWSRIKVNSALTACGAAPLVAEDRRIPAQLAGVGPRIGVEHQLVGVEAMALFRRAVSAWCVVSGRDRDNSTFFLVAGIAMLALANDLIDAVESVGWSPQVRKFFRTVPIVAKEMACLEKLD